MFTNKESDNALQRMIDIQIITNRMSMPWLSASEVLSKQFSSINLDDYTEEWKAFSSFADLYRVPNYLDSSAFTRNDVEDGKTKEEKQSLGTTSFNEVNIVLGDNTRLKDINQENDRFRAYLDSQTRNFIRTLTWTEFEDGMENDIIRQVAGYMEKNRYVTYCWLNKIFNDNRTKPIVTSGLLRILSMVVNSNDADIMLSMVTSGLASQYSEDQEAAIMVVEKWRTKECYDAMTHTTYGSDWVKEYAMQVAEEIKNERGL